MRSLNETTKLDSYQCHLANVSFYVSQKETSQYIFSKNWRLISLLALIYKLVSSAVSVRLKSVLDNIISLTQSGFVANHIIGENIHIIYAIIHYTKTENIPGLLIFIDFQRALDLVSWKFVHSVLKFFWLSKMDKNFEYKCKSNYSSLPGFNHRNQKRI